MPLPQANGSRCMATMRTSKSRRAFCSRTSSCQRLPAAVKTSSMPYKAEPAVSRVATISTCFGFFFCCAIHASRWHECPGRGTSESYSKAVAPLRCASIRHLRRRLSAKQQEYSHDHFVYSQRPRPRADVSDGATAARSTGARALRVQGAQHLGRGRREPLDDSGFLRRGEGG